MGTVTGGEIVYVGSATSVTDLSAAYGTDYNYIIFPYRGGGAATNYLTTTPLKAVIDNPFTPPDLSYTILNYFGIDKFDVVDTGGRPRHLVPEGKCILT